MVKPKEYKYEAGERTFIQRKLVIGQAEQLIDILSAVSFNASDLSVAGIKNALGVKLYQALAIVLREKDVEKWWEKDIEEMAEHLRWNLSPEDAVKVIEDFFDCNPLVSLLEKLRGVQLSLTKQITGLLEKDGASSSAATSQQETSPDAT